MPKAHVLSIYVEKDTFFFPCELQTYMFPSVFCGVTNGLVGFSKKNGEYNSVTPISGDSLKRTDSSTFTKRA